ncbi:hypothetical protein C8Q77DRAFT_1212500 [Trametes polyzona]|nr:hypothetical protein C8Q77DRAFT_1212500 [Trametes polyzona]
MVRWRTACTVIVIFIGAALLTFAVFIWRRRKMLRRPAPRPEMQQRFMSSYAFDPEAHTPLLYSEAAPPLPPKTQTTAHHRDRSGDVDEWGFKLRVPPPRVPVPPLYLPSEPKADEEGARPRSNADSTIPMPEPSVVHKLFTPSTLLQFPKLQLTRDNTRVGRFPSLHIQFVRESSQVVSSPAATTFPEPDKRVSLPESMSSVPSTLSRPFATMSNSPLPPVPPIPPISPISISHVSETSGALSTRSDSVASVGRNLFARKASGEDVSEIGFSRASSQQSRPPRTPIPTTNGAASRSSSSGSRPLAHDPSLSLSSGAQRQETAWSPNVMASYSPWQGLVRDSWSSAGDSEPLPEPGSSRAVESPTGQIRVADAWRPMPTLEEGPESVVGARASMPRPLPEPPASPPVASSSRIT